MHLHLIIPGLLRRLPIWQRDYNWHPEAAKLRVLLNGMPFEEDEYELSALSAAALLGWRGTKLPAAGYRALAQGLSLPPEGDWVCADPVHLQADANGAVIHDCGRFALRLDEAQELVSNLESTLGGEGWHFHLGAANAWYLQVPVGEAPDGPMLDAVIGRDLRREWMPSNSTEGWRRRLTEIEMLLYQHPVNQAREARGEPTINSLWCWGQGRETGLDGGGMTRVMGQGALLAGFAKASGIELEPLSLTALDPTREGRLLLVLDTLAESAAYDDLSAWEQALLNLDADWFARLHECVVSGEIASMVLHADGRCWQIQRRRRFFSRWRRPRPLAESLGAT